MFTWGETLGLEGQGDVTTYQAHSYERSFSHFVNTATNSDFNLAFSGDNRKQFEQMIRR